MDHAILLLQSPKPETWTLSLMSSSIPTGKSNVLPILIVLPLGCLQIHHLLSIPLPTAWLIFIIPVVMDQWFSSYVPSISFTPITSRNDLYSMKQTESNLVMLLSCFKNFNDDHQFYLTKEFANPWPYTNIGRQTFYLARTSMEPSCFKFELVVNIRIGYFT